MYKDSRNNKIIKKKSKALYFWSLVILLKPNYDKKQQKLVLTFPYQCKGNNTGPKWEWSTQQGSFISQMHETSLLSSPSQFGPELFP